MSDNSPHNYHDSIRRTSENDPAEATEMEALQERILEEGLRFKEILKP